MTGLVRIIWYKSGCSGVEDVPRSEAAAVRTRLLSEGAVIVHTEVL
jgi:hypothetical protein